MPMRSGMRAVMNRKSNICYAANSKFIHLSKSIHSWEIASYRKLTNFAERLLKTIRFKI